MPPAGGGKRKRGDRNYATDSRDDGTRPSPHRPDSLSLAQRSQPPPHQTSPSSRGGNSDRSRGGRRGGRNAPSAAPKRSPVQSPTTVHRPQQNSQAETQNATAKPEATETGGKEDEPSEAPVQKPRAPTPEEDKPSPPLLPYCYEFLTESVTKDWKDSGRAEILAKAVQARDAEDELLLSSLYQELIRAAVDGTLNPHDCGTFIKETFPDEKIPIVSKPAVNDMTVFDAVSTFLDTMSTFGDCGAVYEPMRPLIEATEIPMKRLMFQLDALFMGKIGFVRYTGNFRFTKRQNKYATNAVYRQANFNLLREESEGYSKLVTEYFTTSNNEPPTTEVVRQTFERVQGMIGAFDMYVGRVLDITLDVFAAVLVKQYRFFVKFLRVSAWWPQNSLLEQSAAQHCLGPLPRWALPGHEGRLLTVDEKIEVEELQAQRDTKFWARCREVGLPAFFELGGRQVVDKDVETALEESTHPEDSPVSHVAAIRKWIEMTGTIPPNGHAIAAQILGFKLRFYNSHIRDPSDILPVNLIYLSALLIKIGFISIVDLYTHLWPDDAGMALIKDEKLKEKAEREKQSRPGGGTNALLAAAPLPDDTLDVPVRDVTRLRDAEVAKRQLKPDSSARATPASPSDDKPELPEPTEQKIQLLKSLLAIGAIPEALYMLGQYSWLMDTLPDLPEYIHRILHHCLSKIYDPIRPLNGEDGLTKQQKVPDNDQTGMPKGSIKLADMPARRVLRWAQLDKDDTTESVDYRFYWDDWADTIPVCQTVDDVFTLCDTLLNLSGVKIGQDPMLVDKLARIGRHSLEVDSTRSNYERWMNLSKRLLVPALSFVKCSPGTVNEVFQLLKHFSASTRYNIYAEWHSGSTSRLPDIKSAFEQTKLETRDVLKRISKENIKQMARSLAKVAYSSPTVVFSVAIGQLESYENLVDTFVECVRFFTHLAYDVLIWSLMSSLGAQGRNRLQSDGILTSKWLASLALFSGKVFKRYQDINPLPIIQYVEYQLRQGNPTDLIVLEDIVRSMAGITSDVSYNEAQVLAMSGGELLQSQTLLQLMDRRHESSKESRRLVGPLKDKGIAGQVLVSLAQERQMAVFRVDEENAHPKLLGNLLDQMHRILGQYLELLRTNLTTSEFDAFVPRVSELIAEFGIDPSIAFWVSRQSINAAIDQYDDEQSKTEVVETAQPLQNGSSDGQVSHQDNVLDELPDAVASEAEPATSLETSIEAELKTDVDEMAEAAEGVSAATEEDKQLEITQTSQTSLSISEEARPACHPILQDVADRIKSALAADTWDALSPSFFVTFWHLSLSDIHVPVQQYDDEVKKLSERTKIINQDRTDISVAGTEKKRQEKKTIETLISNLLAEMKKRMLLKQVPRLRKEKNHWFTGPGTFNDRHVALIEHCFFPRMVMSPSDSHYTFRMIKWLHKEAAANFRTMGVYDQFFREKRLTSMIFLCSSKEAECLGRFINDVLRDFSLWHADKKVYEKEAHGPKKNLPGFARKAKNAEGAEEDVFLPYEDFRRLLMKWHRNINGALKNCYGSGEYMHIRNAINILNNIYTYFPAVNWMGSNQLSSITELSTKEKREDLKIAATSLIGALKKREKHWVLPQAFNLIDGNQATNRARGNSAKPVATSPGEAESKALNPTAPEFKPGSQPSSSGEVTTAKASAGNVDAEDGEIDDAQIANGTSNNQTPAKTADNTTPETAATGQPDKSSTATSKQDQVSAAIPAPKPAPVPARPEPARTRSANIANGQHNLPSKPDLPHSRQGLARGPPPHDGRHAATQGRDTRASGRAETDGARDLPRGPERLATGPSTRVPAVDTRRSRPMSDDGHGRHTRDTRPLPADDRPIRPPNDRPIQEQDQTRRDLITGQRDRDGPGPPTANGVSQHPDRAALIHGPAANENSASRFPSERHGHGGPDRRLRGSSPSRGDHRGPMYERNEPPPDLRGQYDSRPTHPPYHDAPAPTGPRGERPPLPSPNHSNERFRDGQRSQHQPSGPVDMQYGRLRPEPVRHQSESFGRLSQDHEAPSGPRLSNGNTQPAPRGGRNASGPASSFNAPAPAATQNAPPSSDRQAPTGPGLRNANRNQAPQSHAAPPVSPANANSGQEGETAGIHPDRLRAMQGPGQPLAARTGPATRQSDRMPSSPASAQSQEMARNGQDLNAGPNAGRGPPTGPADKRSDKRFTGLQSVLQQSNSQPMADRSIQGTSIRGRGARANPAASPASSDPPTPSASFPPSDAFSGRSGPPQNMPNDEDGRYGRGFRHGQQDGDRRGQRPRSRSPGRGRAPDLRNSYDGSMPPPREDPRDRFRNDGPGANIRGNADSGMRGGGPPPGMDRELRGGPPRRGARDDILLRDGDKRENQEWGGGDRRGGMPRRGDERDARDGGGSLRKRGRMDEGYGDRGMENKRPRR